MDKDYVTWLTREHHEALPEHPRNTTKHNLLPAMSSRISKDSIADERFEAYPEEDYMQWLYENHPDALLGHESHGRVEQ